MATTSKGGIRRDAFVKSVRPDPKSTEALVVLQGYIGNSDLDGHVRVYFDPALSDFIDLPEKDILYSDPVKTTDDPLGGSRMWIKKTTVFTAGDPNHANRVKSSFLEGDIMKAFGDISEIPTVVRTIGHREKISVPKTNCGTFQGPCLTGRESICICVVDKTNIRPCPPRTTPAAGCPSVTFECTTPVGCPPPTKIAVNCPVDPAPSIVCQTEFARVCQPLSAQGCTIGCTYLKDCTDRTICIQNAPPSFYNPTCKFHVTCPVIRCDAEVNAAYYRAATRVRTSCDCAYDHDQPAPTVTRTINCYEGGFNPYRTAY